MAISGPEALKSLDDAIRDIRLEEQDLQARVSRSTELVTKLQLSEADWFKQLARLRLTPEMQKSFDGRLSKAEAAARDVVARHAASLSQINEKIKQLDEKIAGLAHDRRDALGDIDRVQDALTALSAEIGAAITADPDYAEKRGRADHMRAVAEESLKKTLQAEEDRETKGRPYRDDILFMYLWEAGYGTRNYKANNLVRWLDSLVARMIGFHDARPNYAMLNEIPMRLREHAERQAAAADAADAELDEIESRAIEEAGGGPLKSELLAAQERVETIDAQMVDAEDERDQLTQDLADLAERPDAALEVAASGLAGSLQSMELSQLVAEARRTPSPADDAILKKIDDARLRIVDEESETRKLKDRLRVLARRRRELEDIEFEFKKKRFDDPRSTFREDNLVGDLLGEFLRGAITAGVYWSQWQRSQHWRPSASDWGGSIGLPKSGRRSSWPGINIGSGSGSGINWGSFGSSRGGSRPGGGFSRPRSGSRGTRKSGGFKTGGGF